MPPRHIKTRLENADINFQNNIIEIILFNNVSVKLLKI